MSKYGLLFKKRHPAHLPVWLVKAGNDYSYCYYKLMLSNGDISVRMCRFWVIIVTNRIVCYHALLLYLLPWQNIHHTK